MFKYGHNKNGTGSSMLADKVSDGIKQVEENMETFRKYIKEHKKDYAEITENLTENIVKNSEKIALTSLGVGILLYSLYKWLK